MLILSATVAWAATIDVPGDTPSLASAVLQAGAGGTVVVAASYTTGTVPVEIPFDLTLSCDLEAQLPPLVVGPVDLVIEGGTLAGTDAPARPAGAGGGNPVAVVQSGGSLTLLGTRSALAPDRRALLLTGVTLHAEDTLLEGGSGRPWVTLIDSEATFVRPVVRGHVGTLVVVARSDLWVEDADISGVTTRLSGAAILAALDSTVVVHGGRFADLHADRYGGAIAITDGSLDVLGVTFEDTTATVGGAIAAWSTGQQAPEVRVEGSRFVGTTASEGAGALFVDGGAAYVLTTSFERPVAGAAGARGSGGAIAVSNAELTVEDVGFTQARAGFGGALGASASSVTMRQVDLVETDAGYGGGLFVRDSDVVLEDVFVTDARAGIAGGVVWSGTSRLTWRGGDVTDTRAPYGGTLYADRGVVDLRDVRAVGGHATVAGGFAAAVGAELTVDGLDVSAHVAGAGAGIFVEGAPVTAVSRSRFCDNTAMSSGAAVAVVDAVGPVSLQQLVVGGSSAEEGAAVHIARASAPVEVHQSTFVGNRSAVDILISEAEADVRNVILHHATIGVYADPSAVLTGGYTLFWENGVSFVDTSGGSGFPGPSPVFADPRFEALAPGDCLGSNLTLGPGSPAAHAGDPTILDDDGSRSSIGAWGGPSTGAGDRDGDGADDALDCDDDDPTVRPGANEIWYDDLDQDCDGNDDDQDLDGAARSIDCDDEDPTVGPGAAEVAGDGVDQDCASERWFAGGVACDGGPRDHRAWSWGALWLAWGAVARRFARGDHGR